jgi:hypothetical protein
MTWGESVFTHVYFATAHDLIDGPVKVGRSADIPKRLRELHCPCCGKRPSLIASGVGSYWERWFKARFAGLMIDGSEWFVPDDETRRVIQQVADGEPSPLLVDTIAERVKYARLRARVSPLDIWHASGIEPKRIESIEASHGTLRISEAWHIARAIGCPLDAFVPGGEL